MGIFLIYCTVLGYLEGIGIYQEQSHIPFPFANISHPIPSKFALFPNSLCRKPSEPPEICPPTEAARSPGKGEELASSIHEAAEVLFRLSVGLTGDKHARIILVLDCQVYLPIHLSILSACNLLLSLCEF